MWLMTTFGFFSIVQKPDDLSEGTLTIRSRARDDLEALGRRYLPALGEIVAHTGTDYPYRARVSRVALAGAMQQIVHDIEYGNFKDAVEKAQGAARAHTYARVWSALLELEHGQPSRASARRDRPSASAHDVRRAYGGVLIDDQGRVLLRKPANAFDGYVWTFAKGGGQRDQSPEEVALTEVLEETGYHARIIARLPGRYGGFRGTTEYFLMAPLGEQGPFDTGETERTIWVPPEEAREYIRQTRKATGRERDLEVLQAAVAAYRQLTHAARANTRRE